MVGQMFHVKHWLWRCSCAGRRVCCPAGRAARSARGRRPARSPSAPRASLGASSRSPARPRHRPRAPQPGPPVTPAPSTPVAPGVLARPGPATAHGHRGQALRSLWRPPHRWHLVCWPALAPPPPTGTATVPATECKKSAALRVCGLAWNSGGAGIRSVAVGLHQALGVGELVELIDVSLGNHDVDGREHE